MSGVDTEFDIWIDGSGDTMLTLSVLKFSTLHRLLRAMFGLTISDVAGAVGVDEYTITRWERRENYTQPQESTREKLAEFYGMFGVPMDLFHSSN